MRGVTQEIYALLTTYQVLRIAISDTTLHRADLDPDRGVSPSPAAPLATTSSSPPAASPTPCSTSSARSAAASRTSS